MTATEKYFVRKNIIEKTAFFLLGLLSLIVIGILLLILGFILWKGAPVINWGFITKMPEDGMTKGGIYRLLSERFG